jgi:hypothetical protein
VNERFDYTCPDIAYAIAKIPDNARRVGPGSRAARTSAMSGRQVGGQAPGNPALPQYIRGMVEQTDKERYAVKTVESWKTQVDNSNIGTLAVGSDRWEGAAAQVRNRRG